MCWMMLAVPWPWPGSWLVLGVHHSGRWSGPTRHRLPVVGPHSHGELRPHSQMLNTIGRPVLFNESRIMPYSCGAV